MKKKFSTAWKSSKQPRKQRKYLANAPMHLKIKNLGVNLSKELRKKYTMRNTIIRKGDTVKIMRGKFKKKQGIVSKVDLKKLKIIVEGIQVKKMDGSKANVPLKASNLQIIKAEVTEIKKETESTKSKEVKPKLEEKK